VRIRAIPKKTLIPLKITRTSKTSLSHGESSKISKFFEKLLQTPDLFFENPQPHPKSGEAP
jgi:hypothetical protein